MVSPRRTRVSMPCFVCSSRSFEGLQVPASPNTTTADPPNLKTDFSSATAEGGRERMNLNDTSDG
jgi:hypothetical protein